MAKYVIEMAAAALVKGTYRVEADSAEEAEAKALEHTGDVLWRYEGVQDDTVEVTMAIPEGGA